MTKEERLKDYLEGYEAQYLYRNEDGMFHTLNDDIKELLEENKKLSEKNTELKERIAYLERSNDRREDEILFLRADYGNKAQVERDLLQLRINKAIEYLESYNTDFKNCRFGEAPISIRELGDLLEILKGEE